MTREEDIAGIKASIAQLKKNLLYWVKENPKRAKEIVGILKIAEDFLRRAK